MRTIKLEEFKTHLIRGQKIIDVRAPIEFQQGAIPGSENLPILSDEERHEIGICYKNNGQDAAIKLGHERVSGQNLDAKRVAWEKYLENHPDSLITCFRGGLRSQTAQKFLQERGFDVPRLEKGYKFARKFFLETISAAARNSSLFILSGTTGSGKTHLLNDIGHFFPAVDLEGLAHHRGSAFGSWDIPQPCQADFENRLATKFLCLQPEHALLLEDESRMIGHRHIPEIFFAKMRESPVILMEEAIEHRIENIYQDYISSKLSSQSSETRVKTVLDSYRTSVQKIKNKLGGLRAQELMQDLDDCELTFSNSKSLVRNKVWIEKLLVWYYDPMYLGSLQKRTPMIEFKGNRSDIKEYFRSKVSSSLA